MASRNCLCYSIAFILFIIGAALLTAGLVVVLSSFPNILHNKIEENKVLGLNDDGTLNQFTAQWVNNKYIASMQFWVFNYTNTIGIMNRAIYPDMIEKGPYTYDEVLTMDKVKISDDGEKMEYRQIQTFKFNRAKSCKTCNPYKDRIRVPDIGFQLGVDSLDEMVEKILHSKLADQICEQIMKSRGVVDPKKACINLAEVIEGELGLLFSLFNISPFVDVTVDELLFSSYNTPFISKFLNVIIEGISQNIPKKKEQPISLMDNNSTSDTVYTVLTGKSDPSKTGYIVEFKNITNASLPSNGTQLPNSWWPMANLNFTKDPTHALQLKGTNGDFFKNFISKSDKLPVYIKDICRSVNLTFDKEIQVDGINAYRFRLPPSEFDYKLEENRGFCNPLKYGSYESKAGTMCLPSGLLDISHCKGGAPIIISKPHFFESETVVSRFVPRFKSNYETDATVIDIEPKTGTVLRAMKRLQINALVNQFQHIRSLSVMRPGAYPLVWLNESFYIDEETQSNLNSQVFKPVHTVEIVCWIAVGVGGAMIAISLLMILVTTFLLGEGHKKTL